MQQTFATLVVIITLVASELVNAQFPDTLDLATTPADIAIWGARAADEMGSSMATGDIDGDGLADIVIVACNAQPLTGARQGETYIIWGSALPDSGTIDLLTEPNVSRIFGVPGDDDLYCRVACGDFNNDGRDDILLGEPRYPGFPSDGKAYVILGQPNFPDTLDLTLSHANVVTIHGKDWSFGWMGRGLCACDMNGDGYDEIVVAATALTNAEIYVIAGDSTFQSSYDMDTAEPGLTRIIEPEANRGTGMAMACEDIDGDGKEDLLIGAPGIGFPMYDGRVTLLYGQIGLPDTLLLDDPAYRMKRILPEYSHGALGWSVAIGDVDGDEEHDLVVSAYLGDPLGCLDCGLVYVLHDVEQMPDSILVDSQELAITRVLGYGSSTHYGAEVGCADVTADNLDDIVISNWPYSPYAGEVSVAYSSGPVDTVFLQTNVTQVSRIRAASNGDLLGLGLVIGDFNRDGAMDLLMGAAFGDPPGRNRAGVAYMMFGDSVPTSVVPGTTPPIVLRQNYPNPFSSETAIDFELQSACPVVLTIYNILGQRVAEITRPFAGPGPGQIVWNGRDAHGQRVATGIYFYRLQAGGFVGTKKLVILR